MLEGWHFQNAYICDDIQTGIDQFRGRGLEKEPPVIEVDISVDAPQGTFVNSVKVALIWIGDLQYELIQPVSDPLGIYGNCLSNGGTLRLHHICMKIDDWDDFRARVVKQDLPIAMERSAGDDTLKFLYLDARAQFGHYLEYVWVSDERWQQMRAM